MRRIDDSVAIVRRDRPLQFLDCRDFSRRVEKLRTKLVHTYVCTDE